MPKVLEAGEYTVVIFTNDHPPPHVHVRKGPLLAKVGLQPAVSLLRYDKNLSAADLRKMVQVVKDNREFLISKWYAFYPEHDDE